MFVAEITFGIIEGETTEEQNEEVNTFLGVMRMSGRVLGKEFLLIQNKNNFVSIVPIPAKDAFENLANSKYVQKSLDKFAELKLKQPIFKILGIENSESLACGCAEINAFILFTTYVLIQSPLRCSECFLPIQLYKIPPFPNSGDSYEIIVWQSDYKSCDSLQMNCQTGERFALRQMLEIDSSLTKQGLKICVEIKKLTNKDCYYYLHKYRGKTDETERARKCPLCSGEWLLPKPWHDLFDFKCDNCCLLSNIAVSLS